MSSPNLAHRSQGVVLGQPSGGLPACPDRGRPLFSKTAELGTAIDRSDIVEFFVTGGSGLMSAPNPGSTTCVVPDCIACGNAIRHSTTCALVSSRDWTGMHRRAANEVTEPDSIAGLAVVREPNPSYSPRPLATVTTGMSLGAGNTSPLLA